MDATSMVRLSVVVPVHDAGDSLDEVLRAIRASELSTVNYELIVVDDGSVDASQSIAARYADTLVRLGAGARGPAYARNRGAELARGDIVCFIDADVRVRPDTLSRMLALFAQQPDIDAVSATYDDAPTKPGLVSQYWNLALHLRAQRAGSLTGQFISACGAVRRSVLLRAGLYNEWHYRSRLEDVELGCRLEELGHKTVVIRGLHVTHLKRWNLRQVLADAWESNLLMGRCLTARRARVTARTGMLYTLSGIVALAIALSAAAAPPPARSVTLSVALVILILADRHMFSFLLRRRGLAFALGAVPIHIATQFVGTAALCVGWSLRHTIGDPLPDATTQAFSEVGVEVWPPVPRRR